MEIELKSQSDNEMVFIVRDAEVPFINAIRRCAMVNVPKIAIEDVNIIKNDSAMFNEVLAHRLGLTPLVSDLDALEGLLLPEDEGKTITIETMTDSSYSGIFHPIYYGKKIRNINYWKELILL